MLAEKYVTTLVSIFDLLVLLKIVACMPESILVYKKTKIRPSHHVKSLCAIMWTSFAFKWVDEVNDHCFGQPSRLSNYMRVNIIPFIVSINTPKRK